MISLMIFTPHGIILNIRMIEFKKDVMGGTFRKQEG